MLGIIWATRVIVGAPRSVPNESWWGHRALEIKQESILYKAYASNSGLSLRLLGTLTILYNNIFNHSESADFLDYGGDMWDHISGNSGICSMSFLPMGIMPSTCCSQKPIWIRF